MHWIKKELVFLTVIRPYWVRLIAALGSGLLCKNERTSKAFLLIEKGIHTYIQKYVCYELIKKSTKLAEKLLNC